VSGAELPERLAPGHTVTPDDIRELVGAATPHFALQLRDRLRRLIGDLPQDDPVRVEAERGMSSLEQLAQEGQTSGPIQEHERPLPSLRLGSTPAIKP
jgi:hypothetical protein